MNLKKEITNRASIFNKEIDTFLTIDDPTLLYEASRHLPLAGGKRLRPVLSMLACEAVGGNANEVIPFGMAVEIIHNFTLVHDDIMDKSTLRRNLPTVHLEYSEPTAILAGDLLFVKAFEALDKYPKGMAGFRELNNHLIRSVIEVCEGQQLDMNFEKRLIVQEDEYLDMIAKKTSALFRIASDGGALVGGASKKQQNAMNIFGTTLGLSFQIQDDFLDMSSDTKTLGKDIGNDIRNGKKTLIAVHCLNNCKGEDKKTLEKLFGKSTANDDEIQQVHEIFHRTESIKYASQKAKEYNDQAIKQLECLPESPSKEILHDLAVYAMTREK